jgi:copper(I)-binding protein
MIAALALAACAPAASAPDIRIDDAWARATAAGQSSGAVYATIVNSGGADRLVGVTSEAGMAMLHDSSSSDGMARMRMVDALAVPASGQLRLAPGGTHVMLSGLRAPLVAGQKIRVSFRFAGAGPRDVDVAIVAPGSR